MSVLLLAGLIGVVAGLRTMTALAAASWGAALGWLPVAGTPLAFFGIWFVPYVASALAVAELITDQLPSTPSRTVPVQFAARIVSGGLSGAAIGAVSGSLLAGAAAGIIGAILGTLGGARARRRLVAATGGRDLPVALAEDAVAVVGALAILVAASHGALP